MKNKGIKLPVMIAYLSAMTIAYSCTKEDLSADNTSDTIQTSETLAADAPTETATTSTTTRIEAESYTSMSGVVLDACSEGGKNVGGIAAGEWMKYTVTTPAAGSYKMNFRVAGNGGSFQVRNSAGSVLATVTVPSTGGWQKYTTVSVNANLAAGQQTIQLYAVTAGYNINWFEIVGGTTSTDTGTGSTTTPTTPTTGSAFGSSTIGSNITYRENFEDATNWPGGLGNEWRSSYGFTTATSPKLEGTKVGRFELRDTDELPRSEVRWPSNYSSTADRWFAFSVYWPSNGQQNDAAPEVFHQAHQTSKTSPPLSMTIKNGRMYAEINGQVFSGVLGQGSGTKTYDIGAVPKDQWVRFVIRYKFSYNTDGIWQIWKNGTQVHNYAGKTIFPPAITSSLPAFKLGIYKWPWNGTATTGSKLRIMYVDDVRIGNEKSSLSTM